MIAIKYIALKRLFTLALWGFFCISGFSQPLDGACEQVQAIDQAQRSVVWAQQRLAQEAVDLPDTLERQWLSDEAEIAYTLALPDCPSGQGLFIYRAGAPYQIITDNGVPLASVMGTGSAAAHTQYNGRVPALFALPAGARSVRVVFQTKPHLFLGLLEVASGPVALLAARQAQAQTYVVGWGFMAAGVLVVLGLLGLFLWLQRRAQWNLFWLALACLLWGTRGLVYFSSALALPARWFELFNPLMVLLTSIALALACLFTVRKPTRYAPWVLIGVGTGGAALALVSGLGGPGMALSIAANLALGQMIVWWLLWWLFSRRRALGGPAAGALALALVANVVFGVHDALMLYQQVPSTQPYVVFWGFTAVLLVFVALSSSYMMRNLRRAEQANEELERTIAAKTEQLQASFALLREAEHEGGRAVEREHLLREMHDGIGAQLMTAMRGVERGVLAREQVLAALQDSLDDLRLLMDSADLGRTLQGALAGWRSRWDPRLQALGITLAWEVEEGLGGVALAPDAVLQIMRILQEATANVVKHAEASQLRMRAWQALGQLHLQVTDDGVGLSSHPSRAGARGLPNMQARAKLLGGQLQIAAQRAPERGTQATLTVPLAAVAAS